MNSAPAPGARPTVLLVTATALFFLTLALALYELDRQRYMGAKKEIITSNFYEVFRLPDELTGLGKDALYAPTPYGRQVARERLERTLREIVDGPTSMYRFELMEPDGQTVLTVAAPEKLDRLNTWRNNLFLRSFRGLTDQLISRPTTLPTDVRQVGRLRGHYTSPPGNAAIERLTVRYRWSAAALVAVWAAAYYFMYRHLLKPMLRVTQRLEVARQGTVSLIPRASGALEKAYNDIASRAILQEIGRKLNTAGTDEAARRRALSECLDLTRQSFGLSTAWLAELVDGDDGPIAIERVASPPDAIPDQATAAASADASHPEDQPFVHHADGAFRYIGRSAAGTVVIGGVLDTALPAAEFRARCTAQAAETMAGGVAAYRSLQRTIARQRSEANMILSRNLGHDLTNIIATGKLDLMAVRQIIGHSSGHLDGAHLDALRQSVDGVLRSTRFLQEIVNIYRSFSYVKRPAFERHKPNELVDEFLTSFEPTVSAKIAITRELDPTPAAFIVEPRLLKLALFNVMVNALDALKRTPSVTAPRVVVRTHANTAAGEFRIEIEDNGPGIRDTAGRLLDRGEIDAIFRYGYSTKEESSEGLGLNWVRTIICDFHNGTVRAENLPAGGARFTLVIRSMDSAEAHVGPRDAAAPGRAATQ